MWLFLQAGLHQHVFEANVEAELRLLDVTGGHSRPIEAEVKFNILRSREVIFVSYMEVSEVQGCSEVSRGCPELLRMLFDHSV